ncbi:MAG: hypothetical protein A3H97_13965 [Acidobacteria bacterium RIFCSPLOWO2_02_FULL_65_29]|nr:MAG: hypothetical protein A3H97_13965 [Acidobacteria bacterium RIFCSPLOWO2_02_FULL_65_29]
MSPRKLENTKKKQHRDGRLAVRFVPTEAKLLRVIEGEIYDVAVDVPSRIADLRALGRRHVVRRQPPAV